MAKVLIGCWNVALNPRRPETSGQHWRKIAADFVRRGRPDAHALRDYALAYATRQDSEPVPDPVPGAEVIGIKYAALADTRLLPKLIAFTDALVAETVAARQSQGETSD
jgi:hypothetical protein